MVRHWHALTTNHQLDYLQHLWSSKTREGRPTCSKPVFGSKGLDRNECHQQSFWHIETLYKYMHISPFHYIQGSLHSIQGLENFNWFSLPCCLGHWASTCCIGFACFNTMCGKHQQYFFCLTCPPLRSLRFRAAHHHSSTSSAHINW